MTFRHLSSQLHHLGGAHLPAVVEGLESRMLMSSAPLAVSQVSYDGGQQLQVYGTPGTSQISIMQTAAGLVVSNGAGWSQTFPAGAGGFKQIVAHAGSGNYSVLIDPSVTVNAVVYGGAGNDTLAAGSGNDILYDGSGSNVLKAGAGNDTLVAIGGTHDTLVGGPGQTTFWLDANAGDTVQNVTAAELAAGAVHKVGSFLGTTPASTSTIKITTSPKATPAHKQAPKPAPKPTPKPANKGNNKVPANSKTPVKPAPATTTTALSTLMTATPIDPKISGDATGYQNYAGLSHPLFADAGPTADDIAQGDVGDCYFLATLASVAKIDPGHIQQSVVQLGDGTYAVDFHRNGTDVYVRVNADLPTTSWGSRAYADFGKQGSIWVAVMEKAYTFFRSGAGTYKSIDAGWMDEAYSALGSTSQTTYKASSSQNLLNLIGTQLAAGKSVTMAFSTVSDGADVITDHAYTVISVNADATGLPATLTVRNPWGVDDNSGKGDGYVTLSAKQVFDSFLAFVTASV